MNPFRPAPLLRSFSWRGFLVFVSFAAALSVWSWSGVLFANKPLTFRDEGAYLLQLLQRNFLNFFPTYVLATLVDATRLRGTARRVAFAAALACGIVLAVQGRCLWANEVFYVSETTQLPYCTAFPTWRTFVDFPAHWIMNFLVSAMVMFFVLTLRRDRELIALLHTARATELETRRQRIESEIEAMQSRVDPDRLLATLAAIRERYERSLAEGEAMLEGLIVELRRAAGHPAPESAD